MHSKAINIRQSDIIHSENSHNFYGMWTIMFIIGYLKNTFLSLENSISNCPSQRIYVFLWNPRSSHHQWHGDKLVKSSNTSSKSPIKNYCTHCHRISWILNFRWAQEVIKQNNDKKKSILGIKQDNTRSGLGNP